MREIAVIGSVNVDLVARASTLPRAGETVIANSYESFLGGKGANQAWAASRMGAHVRFVGCVGNDRFGEQARDTLARSGVDVTDLTTVETYTGMALITLDAAGQNQITVVPGANERVRARGSYDIALLQLETPYELPRAQLVILNPAPAREISLRGVDIVVPNELEAEMLTGEKDPARAALALERRGAGRAIVTLGEKGVWSEGRVHPGFRVTAIDTVGAGDAFCGAFAAALALEIDDPIRFAQACAALKVTKHGAQSVPTRAEVDALLAKKT